MSVASHSSSLPVFTCLTGPHTQERWNPFIHEHFLHSNVISYDVSNTHRCTNVSGFSFLLCSRNHGRLNNKCSLAQDFKHKALWLTKRKRGNCFSIIIQRKSSHKGKTATAQRTPNIALTKLILFSKSTRTDRSKQDRQMLSLYCQCTARNAK